MYNIAFTGIIIVTVLGVADIDRFGAVILQSIGVLWGTLFSALAFVFPRLLEVHRARKKSSASKRVKEEIQKYLQRTSEWNSRLMELSRGFEGPTPSTLEETSGVTEEREVLAPPTSRELGRKAVSVNIQQAMQGERARPMRKSVATEFIDGKEQRKIVLLRRSASWNVDSSCELDLSRHPDKEG